MKMSPEEDTQERALDRERWALHRSRANDAWRNQCAHTDNTHTTSTLIWSTNRTVESSFNDIIQKMKANTVKALHFTNTDWSKHTNSTHKAIVCLICDCFVMSDSSQVSSMSVADIRGTVVGWDYKLMKNAKVLPYTKTWLHIILCLVFLECYCFLNHGSWHMGCILFDLTESLL